jgi:hypothetical protein
LNNNNLIKTNKLWYKIKRFFNKFFKSKEESEKQYTEISNDFFENEISMRDEIEEKNKKEKYLRKLLNNEIDINNLSEEEIDKISDYIDDYLLKLNRRLKELKQEISDNIKKF